MRKFTLEIFLKLIGVGAASGLLFQDQQILVISDNSDVLYAYEMAAEKLNKIALSQSGALAEQLSKATKSDFEALTTDGRHLYIFGSGSGAFRNTIVELDARGKELIGIHNLDILYESMRSFAQIDAENFNIEGVAYANETWYFFNRGNGPKGQNGVFTITGENILEQFNIVYNPISLPKIGGTRASFTDAVVVDDKVYFLAASEASNSTYADGAILGSLIGRLNLERMKVEFTQIISKTHKFEGLSLYSKTAKELTFLLCEDADHAILETTIYKLSLKP